MKTQSKPLLDVGWLESIREQMPSYLARLKLGEKPGRYLPCERGSTPVGREMALGFSCFALKLQVMLGDWTDLPESERAGWIEFLQRFQSGGESQGAFIDLPQIEFLQRGTWRDGVWKFFGRGRPDDFARSIILAETKQAIAALAEVGEKPRVPFRDFPLTAEGVRDFLETKDWTRPWGAGGQSAGLVVFLKTQAPALLPAAEVELLLQICRDFYTGLADAESGGYFRGRRPAQGELINGAMKVLMALDWLEVPVHHPEKLVQTCLAHPPPPDGCHLVDAIYVLHQSLRGEASAKVRAYCVHVLELIRRHAHADGGFSFYAHRAQTKYYGVPISRGLDESDIQGTCLLVWALAMIWKILAPESAAWKPMRP
ncbi:MAG TPA: hypothetical protein VF593_01365 [Chthoniobacteraceae bacterium]|jgi:hypothetical protein